jgi:hypothetical protein
MQAHCVKTDIFQIVTSRTSRRMTGKMKIICNKNSAALEDKMMPPYFALSVENDIYVASRGLKPLHAKKLERWCQVVECLDRGGRGGMGESVGRLVLV